MSKTKGEETALPLDPGAPQPANEAIERPPDPEVTALDWIEEKRPDLPPALREMVHGLHSRELHTIKEWDRIIPADLTRRG
jgi:hypothetical protein